MVKRTWVMGGVGAVVLIFSVGFYARLRSDVPAAAARVEPATRRVASSNAEWPRIGLERLISPRPVASLGQRDLFDYAPPPPTPEPPPLPATPPPTPETATPPPLPPLNVKYIGSLEQRGAKVAFLLTDKNEVLTGREGEVVANRFRIVKIGFESVDLQEVGTDRVRRLPLKGN